MQNNAIIAESVSESSAEQFYIAPAGDDATGDGTLSRPWKSVRHAVGSIPRGDHSAILNLRAGTYVLANTLLIDNWRGGVENARLLVKSYQDENAILDGSRITEFGAMISIKDSDYVTISNLELTGLIGNKSGIYVSGDSSHITLSNNKVHDMHWTTDEAAAAAPEPSDNLNPIVIVGNSPNTMEDISVINNKVFNLTTGYSEAIKVVGNIENFLVEGNEVHDISNIGIVAAGNYTWVGLHDATINFARNGVIRNNEVYRCISPVAASAGIYIDGARDITVTNNYSHHNTVGFSVGSEQPGSASSITLTGNVSESNVQAGVVIGTISPDSMVDGVTLKDNELRGNYTSPVWGGAPVVINTSRNISIQGNVISSLSQYLLTVNAASDNLSLNTNKYESISATSDDVVFSWAGVNNQSYTGFDNYRSATGQDSLSTFTKTGNGAIAGVVGTLKNIFGR